MKGTLDICAQATLIISLQCDAAQRRVNCHEEEAVQRPGRRERDS